MNMTDSANSHPVIALMTDFGSGDSDVGVMKGVIAGIAPASRLIDITHDIGPQHVASGAWVLASAYRYFPRGTVFVCVVDPGVGSERGAIAVHAGDWFFVGPDNGLFSYVYAEQTIHGAALLTNPQYQLPRVSTTFHGRDIFAPAGAYLARGVALNEFGAAVAPDTLIRLDTLQAERRGSSILASIIHVDHFGNLITNIPLAMTPELFDQQVRVHAIFKETETVVRERRRFFAAGPTGSPFIFPDSSGFVGIAVRDGNASAMLGVRRGAEVTLTLETA